MSSLTDFLVYVVVMFFLVIHQCFFTLLEIVFLSACFEVFFYCLLRPVALEHSVPTLPSQYIMQLVEWINVLLVEQHEQ